jgi:AcrR family transcriptional regulator
MARTGRRPGSAGPGGSGTQQAILDAARVAFTSAGYDGATVRAIARDAAVDPALVHHYFGTKEQLFVAAMRLPFDPAEVLPALLAAGPDGLGERLLRMFLAVWDSPAAVSPFLGLLRGAMTHEPSAAMLREFVGSAIIGRITAALEVDRPQLRATLVGSQLLGLGFARHIVKLEPIASASPDELAATIAPNLQRYLTGPLD